MQHWTEVLFVQQRHKHFREERVSTEENKQCGHLSSMIDNISIIIVTTILVENWGVMVRERQKLEFEACGASIAAESHGTN